MEISSKKKLQNRQKSNCTCLIIYLPNMNGSLGHCEVISPWVPPKQLSISPWQPQFQKFEHQQQQQLLPSFPDKKKTVTSYTMDAYNGNIIYESKVKERPTNKINRTNIVKDRATKSNKNNNNKKSESKFDKAVSTNETDKRNRSDKSTKGLNRVVTLNSSSSLKDDDENISMNGITSYENKFNNKYETKEKTISTSTITTNDSRVNSTQDKTMDVMLHTMSSFEPKVDEILSYFPSIPAVKTEKLKTTKRQKLSSVNVMRHDSSYHNIGQYENKTNRTLVDRFNILPVHFGGNRVQLGRNIICDNADGTVKIHTPGSFWKSSKMKIVTPGEKMEFFGVYLTQNR